MPDTAALGDFSLDFISARLAEFPIPEGEFDPGGDWRLDYAVYTFTSLNRKPVPGARVGRMTLARKANGANSTLSLDYEKDGPGSRQQVAAELHCSNDSLSTPIRWEYSAQVVDGAGTTYRNSVIAKRGTAQDGRIEIADASGARRIAMNGPFTINWAIWDAVMRMPRKQTDPVRFTMLDHFDQIKRGQTLDFRGSVVVKLGQRRVAQETWRELEKGRIRQTRWERVGGRDVTLHGFEQLGEGIVPWVYWTDDSGRLLFVIAGLEVYAIETQSKS